MHIYVNTCSCRHRYVYTKCSHSSRSQSYLQPPPPPPLPRQLHSLFCGHTQPKLSHRLASFNTIHSQIVSRVQVLHCPQYRITSGPLFSSWFYLARLSLQVSLGHWLHPCVGVSQLPVSWLHLTSKIIQHKCYNFISALTTLLTYLKWNLTLYIPSPHWHIRSFPSHLSEYVYSLLCVIGSL